MSAAAASVWADQLATIQRRRDAGGSWQPQLRRLAATMEAAGATELAREARHVMAVVRSAPDIKARLLRDLVAATAAWQPREQAGQVAGEPFDGAAFDAADQANLQARQPAPATVVPTRYAPDGMTVLQPRQGELVTILVQRDGRDVQALELTPELASHLLWSLLNHADQPRIL